MSNIIFRTGRQLLGAVLNFFGSKIVPEKSGSNILSTPENGLVIAGNGELSEKFFQIQKILQPDYAIEVGAHAAEFSVATSSYFGIEATAFEAGSVVWETYKDSIGIGLVSYLNLAISDIDGTVSFKVTQDQMNGNSGIVRRNGADPVSEIDVQSSRLDTYFKEINFKNACLWVDVEGASKQVLTGGVETLKRVSSVFIETEDHPYWQDQWLTLDVVKFLNSQGFILEESEEVYHLQKNLIFVRPHINNQKNLMEQRSISS